MTTQSTLTDEIPYSDREISDKVKRSTFLTTLQSIEVETMEAITSTTVAPLVDTSQSAIDSIYSNDEAISTEELFEQDIETTDSTLINSMQNNAIRSITLGTPPDDTVGAWYNTVW